MLHRLLPPFVVVLVASVIWLFLVCGCQPITAPTPEPTLPPPTRILFIGDSLSSWGDGLVPYVRGIAAGANPPLTLETATAFFGGATLKDQWEHGTALELIRSGDWQVVVLQEDLAMSAAFDLSFQDAVSVYNDYARRFAVEIEQNGGVTVFYANQEYGYPRNKNAMDFHSANVAVAEAVGARVAPVGLAWQRTRYLAPDLTLYARDRVHPSPTGLYLTAAVIYATIYERSLEGSTWLPSENPDPQLTMSPETLALLQRIAWETVQADTPPR